MSVIGIPDGVSTAVGWDGVVESQGPSVGDWSAAPQAADMSRAVTSLCCGLLDLDQLRLRARVGGYAGQLNISKLPLLLHREAEVTPLDVCLESNLVPVRAVCCAE